MDPGEESFALSSFDFNSSFGLYSSDDDDDNGYTNYHQLNQANKNDIDAYIELDLPPAAMASPPPQVAESDDDGGDKELDFRISFSAVIPFPGFSTSAIDSAAIASTYEDAKAQLTVTASPQPVVESTLSCIHRRAISNHSTMSIFPLDWTRFPPPIVDNSRRPVSDINGWELVRSRKSSAAGNGGITKLLVKLRSIVVSGLGSMRASLAQAGIGTLCKPSEPQQRLEAVRINGEMKSSSNVMEMKFETMRKLFGSGVSTVKINGISKSGRLNKSCPTSIKSSPVHQSGDASLVYAAIAHCKKSFAQNDDFSF